METKIETREQSIGGSFHGKIVTIHECPPVPIRCLDWVAYREDWDDWYPIAHGSTEEEAIKNLLDLEYDLECDLL